MLIKTKVKSGLKWTSFAAIWNGSLQLAQLAILARFFTKDDFGVIAIIMVVIGIGTLFVEAGLSSAVIHRQNLSREDLANAYAVNLSLGLILFVCCVLASSPIAGFYQQPILENSIMVVAAIFLITPFGMQYTALFNKDMRYDFVAKIDVLSASVGTVVTIILAYFDFGVFSLVLGLLVSATWKTASMLLFGIPNYGFQIGFQWSRAKYFLRFGAFRVGDDLLNYLNMQMDVLVIGRLLSAETLGAYFVAKQLLFRPMQLINPIFTKVALPAFARVQNDIEALKSGYLQLVQALTIIHCAVYFLISGFASEISSLVVGQAWGQTVLVLSILAFSVLQRAIVNPVGSLLMAKGKVEIGFLWNFALFLLIPIVVYSSVQISGLTGVVWGLVAMMSFLQIPAWIFLVRPYTHAKFSDYFLPILKTFIVAAICFGPVIMISDIWVKIALALVGGGIYVGVYRNSVRQWAR